MSKQTLISDEFDRFNKLFKEVKTCDWFLIYDSEFSNFTKFLKLFLTAENDIETLEVVEKRIVETMEIKKEVYNRFSLEDQFGAIMARMESRETPLYRCVSTFHREN